jgi:hypothetical protein
VWVRRFARIENLVFSYSKQRGGEPRVSINLRDARVKYSTSGKTSRENIIQESDPSAYHLFIQIKNEDENIVIAFDNLQTYEQWKKLLIQTTDNMLLQPSRHL